MCVRACVCARVCACVRARVWPRSIRRRCICERRPRKRTCGLRAASGAADQLWLLFSHFRSIGFTEAAVGAQTHSSQPCRWLASHPRKHWCLPAVLAAWDGPRGVHVLQAWWTLRPELWRWRNGIFSLYLLLLNLKLNSKSHMGLVVPHWEPQPATGTFHIPDI